MAEKPEEMVEENEEKGILWDIRKSYPQLSNKLKIVAKYIFDNPHSFALNSLNSISKDIDVPQSTFVRLAKFFGFPSALDFQKKIRESLLQNTDYQNRVKYISDNTEISKMNLEEPFAALQKLASQNALALNNMLETVEAGQLERVVELCCHSEEIFLCGVRRVYPLLMAMRYGLSKFHKKVHVINGLGGMFKEEAENITSKSLLLTISYHPYSPEPILVQRKAMEVGAQNILITDSQLHPLFDQITESIIIRDAELFGFRSLSASLCLTHAITLSVGLRCNDPSFFSKKNYSASV